jgi:hypothetical protein
MHRLVTVGLLLVILGLALLLLLPGVMRVREVGNRQRCADNLRKIVAATLLWSDQAHPQLAVRQVALPPGTLPHPQLPPARRLSLIVDLLPLLGVDLPIDRQQPWDAPTQYPAIEKIIPTLCSPETFLAPAPGQPGQTYYVALAGLGTDAAELPADHPRAGPFRYDQATPLTAIRDGTGHTIAWLEAARRPAPWAQGGPATVRGLDPDERPYLSLHGPFGGGHRTFAHTAFCDGSIRPIAYTISPTVFEALATIAANDGGVDAN